MTSGKMRPIASERLTIFTLQGNDSLKKEVLNKFHSLANVDL